MAGSFMARAYADEGTGNASRIGLARIPIRNPQWIQSQIGRQFIG